MKLLVNGCSYTYGYGHKVEDDKFFEGIRGHASPYSWGNTLATKLGYDLVNISTPGSTNWEIAHYTLDYLINNEKPDLVIIMWTYTDRFLNFFNSKVDRFADWEEDVHTKNFFKYVYSDGYADITSFDNMYLLYNYMKRNSINFVFTYVDAQEWIDSLEYTEVHDYYTKIQKEMMSNIILYDDHDKCLKNWCSNNGFDYCDNNFHYGEKAHKEWVDNILYEEILEWTTK